MNEDNASKEEIPGAPRDMGPLGDAKHLSPERWVDALAATPARHGAADIFTFGRDETAERAAAFAAAVLGLASNEEPGRPYFPRALVIGTPQHKDIEESFLAHTKQWLPAKAGSALERLHWQTSENYNLRALERAIGTPAPGTAVLIMHAAEYRATTSPDSPATNEDIWAWHLVATATSCATIARSSSSYFALDAGRFHPQEKANRELILSIADCGVIAGQLPHSDRMTTVDQLSTWNAAIQGGEIELVLAAIAASPGISKDERALLQAQALMRSNKPRLGYELLQREGLYEQQDTGLDVRLALIAVAARASANSVALQIFETLNLQKLDTDELESLLALHINGLLAIGPENVVQLLRALNPDAPILTSYRIQHAFTQRNYVELAIIANESTSPLPDDMRTYLRIIASNLTSSLPDYNSTIATIADRIPTLVDRAYLTCARDALLRKSYDEAIRIAIRVDSHANEATGCFDLVIAATRRRALERGADEALAISPALLVDALAFLARHLAEHPADASRREEVADLFLPESLGSLGNACLVAAAFSWFPYKPEILEEATPERPSISEEELSAFLRDTMDNFKSSGFALVGLGELDKAIEASTAILLLTPLEHMLDHLVNTLADDADVKTVILLLHIGCMTARRAGLPRRRLRWFRVVTTKLALAGWPQRARDLAEQLLQQAHDQDPTELRMAWAAFADVYFRTEDLHHALVGICAAFAIRAPLGAEELWQEFYLLVRVARSLGLWDLSRDTLARVSVILPILNLDYAHRIETIRLTIDFTELTQQDTNIEPHEYRKIVDSMVANLAVIEEKADELAPIIALLGQALTIGQNFSIEPTLHARDSLQAAMARMPLHSRERLLAVIAPQPTMNEILTTLRTIAETKHATDYGHDLYIASVAAKRALGQLANYSMSEAVVLFNLRADHNSIPDGHVRIGDAEALLSAIASLHNANQAVHMIALDQRSHMAHMILEPGHAPVLRTEPTSIFAHQALTVWQEKYPASYPRLPRDAVAEGIVFHSMARIGIGDGIDTRSGIVIIADDALQQIPANLLIADDNFLGISGPGDPPTFSRLVQLEPFESPSEESSQGLMDPVGSNQRTAF